MKRKMICIGILSMFLLLSVTPFSAVGLTLTDESEGIAVVGNTQDVLTCIDGYVPHDEIFIEENDDFTAENGVTGGSGTENDPYIIEGWETPRIIIEDTTKYFIIRNCRIYGKRGVEFSHVENGVIRDSILEDESQSGGWGLEIAGDSHDNIVENVKINDYCWALRVYGSYNNVIRNCAVSHSTWGVIVGEDGVNDEYLYSHHNEFYKVEINDAITLFSIDEGCYKNTVHRCNLTNGDSGFFVMGYDNNIYHNNIHKMQSGADYASCCNVSNQWDDGKYGNFWGDYKGVDLDKDGIGDTPYIINLQNRDRHPFMAPVKGKAKVKSANLLTSLIDQFPLLAKLLNL